MKRWKTIKARIYKLITEIFDNHVVMKDRAISISRKYGKLIKSIKTKKISHEAYILQYCRETVKGEFDKLKD